MCLRIYEMSVISLLCRVPNFQNYPALLHSRADININFGRENLIIDEFGWGTNTFGRKASMTMCSFPLLVAILRDKSQCWHI